ncbi:MAG: hypothetical protein RIS70_938 [Planctomycetota bacterium]|jgi:nicotinamidase-related amidase
MTEAQTICRSPELLSRHHSGLLVVDVQEKLLPLVIDHEKLVWNIERLIDGARLLDVPMLGTEQYPRGLGATVPPLAEKLGPMPSKLTFSCGGCPGLWDHWSAQGRFQVLVVGIETHVCILQTVFDLMHAGFRVFIAVDAVSSRGSLDMQTALRRMESAGATLVTTESALFEWCETAGTDTFKQISQIVRRPPPEIRSR